MTVTSRLRFAFSLLFVTLAVTRWGVTPSRAGQGSAAPVAELVAQARTRAGIPGISVAVVANHQMVQTLANGGADLESEAPVRVDTLYRTASIAKPMTAVAALKLVEEGRLDLDAEVQKYVPDFPKKQWPVTVRQLLGHLGGVRHYRGREVESTRFYPSVASGLAIFMEDPLVHQPGTKYLYTTYGYNLIGAAVEGASKESFFQRLKNTVLAPAGMASTRVDSQSEIIRGRAAGYRRAEGGKLVNCILADTSNKIPGGGLLSTAPDLARFAIAMQKDQLLKPETRQLAWTRQKLTDGTETAYGLGWGLGTWKGHQVVSHGGGQPGVSTLLWMVPERKFAVAIMCNLEGAGLAPLAQSIAEAVLEK